MPFRICKRLTIESGHLLSKHPGNCRFPHGHSRTVEVVLAADELDANDMVCDFKAIRAAVEEFLSRWDHALCLNTDDPHYAFYERTYGGRVVPFLHADPTSERMAKAVYEEARRRAPGGIRVERVRVTETGSTWAEYYE